MSRFTPTGQLTQSFPSGLEPAAGEADLLPPESGAVAIIGEDFAEYKHEGVINERALLAHWQDRFEALLKALPKLETHEHGALIVAQTLTNMWHGVIPTVVDQHNITAVCRSFVELIGPCGRSAEAIGVAEDLAIERTVLHNTVLRLTDFQSTLGDQVVEPDWLTIQRACLKVLSTTAIALGTAPAIQAVLDTPHHALFDRTLSMVKEIAHETQRLEGARAKDPDLTVEQQRIVNLRNSLVGHLTRAFIARQDLEKSGVILACMNEFGADAAPAFDYLLSGTEVSRNAVAKVLRYSGNLS